MNRTGGRSSSFGNLFTMGNIRKPKNTRAERSSMTAPKKKKEDIKNEKRSRELEKENKELQKQNVAVATAGIGCGNKIIGDKPDAIYKAKREFEKKIALNKACYACCDNQKGFGKAYDEDCRNRCKKTVTEFENSLETASKARHDKKQADFEKWYENNLQSKQQEYDEALREIQKGYFPPKYKEYMKEMGVTIYNEIVMKQYIQDNLQKIREIYKNQNRGNRDKSNSTSSRRSLFRNKLKF